MSLKFALVVKLSRVPYGIYVSPSENIKESISCDGGAFLFGKKWKRRKSDARNVGRLQLDMTEGLQQHCPLRVGGAISLFATTLQQMKLTQGKSRCGIHQAVAGFIKE